jgi:hypothetical protein
MKTGQFFQDEGNFHLAWNRLGDETEPLTISQLLEVEEVAKNIGALLRSTKFRLFHNGGNPMLERRYQTRRYELLIKPQPLCLRSASPCFTVHAIVTDSRLLEHRQLFGNTASGQLAVVAQANAGQLAIPPGFWLWTTDPLTNPAPEIADWIDDHLIPWFQGIEDGMEAPIEFVQGKVPFVSIDTALELMLIVYGKEDTGKHMRKLSRHDQTIADALSGKDQTQSAARFRSLVSQFQLLNTAF